MDIRAAGNDGCSREGGPLRVARHRSPFSPKAVTASQLAISCFCVPEILWALYLTLLLFADPVWRPVT
jgi:hypothetical protein